MNQNHLKYLCTEFQLGSPNGIPTSVYGSRGGSFMWRINTNKQCYAIKQLSPDIDLKSERIINKYELSETIANRFSQYGIAAVSAMEVLGNHLIIIENTGYLVYPWVEGYTLSRNEISENHAIKIAELIAQLHKINMTVSEIEESRFDIHSNEKIDVAIEKSILHKCTFSNKLKENRDFILLMNESYQSVIPLLQEDVVVTHGDIDQLNVLWNKADQAILIDWESARKLNKTREIVQVSLGWSECDANNFLLYRRMLQEYIKAGSALNREHLEAALRCPFGRMINWILYNIERACNSSIQKEKDSAAKEINGTLMAMIKHDHIFLELLKISLGFSTS